MSKKNNGVVTISAHEQVVLETLSDLIDEHGFARRETLREALDAKGVKCFIRVVSNADLMARYGLAETRFGGRPLYIAADLES